MDRRLSQKNREKEPVRKNWNERVWEIVAQIPFGKVTAYGHIAALLGSPRKARHVGFALSSCPPELHLPWHRVVNSRGKISFSPQSAQGHIQKTILQSEGVLFSEQGVIDFTLFGWRPF